MHLFTVSLFAKVPNIIISQILKTWTFGWRSNITRRLYFTFCYLFGQRIQLWWYIVVVPDTREAKAWEFLVSRSSKPTWETWRVVCSQPNKTINKPPTKCPLNNNHNQNTNLKPDAWWYCDLVKSFFKIFSTLAKQWAIPCLKNIKYKINNWKKKETRKERKQTPNLLTQVYSSIKHPIDPACLSGGCNPLMIKQAVSSMHKVTVKHRFIATWRQLCGS